MVNLFKIKTHEAHSEPLNSGRDFIQGTGDEKRNQWLLICFSNDRFSHYVVAESLTCPG